MRIIYGITKSNFGGAQRYVFDMALGAKKAGHDVAVLCGGDGLLVQKLHTENIRVISLPSLGRDISIMKDLKSFLFILWTLKKERPDVFHTNSSKMGGMGNLAGRIAGVKNIIFTSHGWAFNENRSFISKLIIKELVSYTILLSHKTICVSDKSRRDVSWMLFTSKKLVVIHNGMDAFDLLPRDEAREILVPNINSNELLVGTISELHHIKGLDILFEAWKEFKRNNAGTLVIVGDGEEKQNLQNTANNLGISGSVVLRGYVENARTLLSGLDIFTLTSRSENLPYAILEAGLASRAVIASAVGGIPEIIEDHKSGILIKKKNVQDLVGALEELANNKNKLETFGNNLNKTVLENFSMDKMIRETLNTYSGTV